VGISRDYPLKTRTSKQPIGEISGYEIIPFHPLKYHISKQGLKEHVHRGWSVVSWESLSTAISRPSDAATRYLVSASSISLGVTTTLVNSPESASCSHASTSPE
jgi:hypothetical protein